MLLGASFTTRNMGVWALTSGAISAILHTYPDADIDLLDYHREPATFVVKHAKGAKRVNLVNIRFSKKIWLPNNIALLILMAIMIKFIPSKTLRQRLFDLNPWLRRIEDTDIVGSIAGGDSFSDIYGFERLVYVALPQILILLLGKPLIVLPQTIGPFDTAAGKLVSRYILRNARKIYSRDRGFHSVGQGQKGKAAIPAAFCYDMGFVLEPRIEKQRLPALFAGISEKDAVVGINVSGLLYIGGYTGKNMFGLKSDYKETVHHLIDHFLQMDNTHVLLVPHVLGEADNRESDTSACREIYQRAQAGRRDHLHVIDNNYDHHEIKAIIGKCDMFLGSRMHACIAALSQSVPAIGLAYSKKFIGVFETIGMEEWVVDLRQCDEKEILDSAGWAFDHRSEYRAKLQATMPSVKTTILNLFSSI